MNKSYVRSYQNSEIADDKNFVKRINYTIESSLDVLPWLFCHDLTMILTSVPCIMIYNHHGKRSMALSTGS